MRAVITQNWWAIWLPVVASLVVLWNCRGCEKTVTGPPEAQETSDTESSKLPPVDVEIDMPLAELPEGLEFGPAETEPWLRHVGTVDTGNRYASVVMIIGEELAAAAPCSGVLAGPRLVLTAGSCVCVPQPSGEASHGAERLLTASSCVERVSVTAVAYEGDSGPEPQVRRTQLRSHEGRVRAHPSLELRVDSRGFVISRRADLAAIFLEEPVQGSLAEVLLPRAEVQKGELLTMVGYGAGEFRGWAQDVRYFRKNKAALPPAPGDDRIFYEQRGAYVYNGFAGGPCFREDSTGQWLVGIAGTGSAENLSCTSIYVYRKWVLDEVQRAMRGGPSRP